MQAYLNQGRKYALSVASSIFIAGSALGFEVQGFKDEMTREAAKNLAERTLPGMAWDDSREAYGGIDKNSEDLFTFSFCENKLVAVDRMHLSNTSFFNALVVVEQQMALRGNPTKVTTGSYLYPAVAGHSGGQGRSLKLEWQQGRERTTLTIAAPDKGTATPSVRYVVANRCGIE